MSSSSKIYFARSSKIIWNNSVLIFILIAFLFLGYIPAFLISSPQIADTFIMLTVIGELGLLICFPIIFGKFHDLLLDTETRSSLTILKQNFWDYFTVSLVLKIPYYMVSGVEVFFQIQTHFITLLISFIIEVLSIYILPLIFFRTGKISPIIMGIKCILGNFRYSLPLVFLVLLDFLVLLYMYFQNLYFPTFSPLGLNKFIFPFFLAVYSIIIKIIIFINASLVLKNTLFAKAEGTQPYV